MSYSLFKFSNITKETSIADFEASKNKPNGNGNARNNTMQLAAVHDDDHALLAPKEQLLIKDGYHNHG